MPAHSRNCSMSSRWISIAGRRGRRSGIRPRLALWSSTRSRQTRRRGLKLQAAYGSYNDARFGLAASGPLADHLFGGIALSYHRRDGFKPQRDGRQGHDDVGLSGWARQGAADRK